MMFSYGFCYGVLLQLPVSLCSPPTIGSIVLANAVEMAESVKLSRQYLRRERPVEQAEEAWTVPELKKSLGYVEGDPFTFLGDTDRRRKVDAFVSLASAGGFEVLPGRSR